MLMPILDVLRILGCCAAFYFGYQIGFQSGLRSPCTADFMTPFIIAAVAGIPGWRACCFPKRRRKPKGMRRQRLPDAIGHRAAILRGDRLAGLAAQWGILAVLTILFTFCFFFCSPA
jgi:hypothetical protein